MIITNYSVLILSSISWKSIADKAKAVNKIIVRLVYEYVVLIVIFV